MKILLLAQFYPPDIGGEERHVRGLAVALQARGHIVEVITSALPQTGPGRFTEEGIPIRRVLTSAQRIPGLHGDARRPHAAPVPDPRMRRVLSDALSSGHYDVVHAHNWIVNSALGPASRNRTPLILTLHDGSHACAVKVNMRDGVVCDGPALFKCVQCAAHHYGALTGVSTALANTFSARARQRHVTSFICVSQSVASRNRLTESGICHQVIPNFIPDDLVVEAPEPFDTGPLVFAGDITAGKGVFVLLEAYGKLVDPPELVLVGRAGPEMALELPDGARLLGACQHHEVMALMRSARAVIVPSVLPDACPSVVLEAMAAGRPVIAAASGGIVDMVVDGVTGLLVAPGDPAALARAMTEVLADPDLAAAFGTAGLTHVGPFTATAVVGRIEALYRETIKASCLHL